MAELVTAAQMRAIERAAMEAGTASGRELMERAGQAVVAAILDTWPDLRATSHSALVLCGPGNNGGDGFVIARLLQDMGWAVTLHFAGQADNLPEDARANHDLWRDCSARQPWEAPAPSEPDVVIDAVFGTGLSRPFAGLEALFPDCAAILAAGSARRVAVDLPSGLCSDSGRVLGSARAADLTVTFHRAKVGHMLADGPALCGTLMVADIGLSDAPPDTHLVTQANALAALKSQGHKYDHGHVLVLSGPALRSGAARLSARAALRIGAGLVTVGAPGSALMECAAQLTAIMLRRCDDGPALRDLLQDRRIATLCLGPGLGLPRAKELVRAALADKSRGVVLDADALTAFGDAPEALFELLHPGCVLTPHAGEFGRLFPDIHAHLSAPADRGPAASKLDATRAAADRAGCVVLYKGADTVIAAPDGRAAINLAACDRAVPWLATAGAGDVLTGFVAGLMARGLTPLDAASIGAWLHVEAARSFGPGLIAEDLPDTLPRVLQGLADQAAKGSPVSECN